MVIRWSWCLISVVRLLYNRIDPREDASKEHMAHNGYALKITHTCITSLYTGPNVEVLVLKTTILLHRFFHFGACRSHLNCNVFGLNKVERTPNLAKATLPQKIKQNVSSRGRIGEGGRGGRAKHSIR